MKLHEKTIHMKYHALFVILKKKKKKKKKQQNLKLSSAAKKGGALWANCLKHIFDQILLKLHGEINICYFQLKIMFWRR